MSTKFWQVLYSLRNLFYSPYPPVRVAILITILGVFTKGISFLKEVVIANYFGTSGKLDAVIVAITVYQTGLLVLNSIFESVIIIVFTEREVKKGEYSLYKFFYVWMSVVVILGVLFGGVIYIMFPRLLEVVAPGLSLENKMIASTSALPFLIYAFVSFISLPISALATTKKFFLLQQIRSGILPCCVLVLLIFTARFFDIYSVPLGWVLGSFISFLLLFPVFFKPNYLPHKLGTLTRRDFFDSDLKKIFNFSIPMTFAFLFINLNVLVERNIASSLEAGSISALKYSYVLIAMPLAFGSVATECMLLPYLSRTYSLKDDFKFRKILADAITFSCFIIIPCQIFFMFFPELSIKVAFERGHFTSDSTALAERILFCYALGMLPLHLYTIFVRTLQSLQRFKSIVIIYAITSSLFIPLSATLPRIFGVSGIAAATTISHTIGIIVLIFMLKRYINKYEVVKFLAHVYSASIVAALGSSLIRNRLLLRYNPYLQIVILFVFFGFLTLLLTYKMLKILFRKLKPINL